MFGRAPAPRKGMPPVIAIDLAPIRSS